MINFFILFVMKRQASKENKNSSWYLNEFIYCWNILNMMSEEMSEWKAKSQAYSLHIPMWDTKSQQTISIKDVILEWIERLENGWMWESWLSYYALVTWHLWSWCEEYFKGISCINEDGDMKNLLLCKPTHWYSSLHEGMVVSFQVVAW